MDPKTMSNDGKSVFSRYIEEPEKERFEEPDIVRRGPQPIIPPAHFKSSPSEKLLDWIINRWLEPTISARDICRCGPNPVRDRKSAIGLAEILVEHGWLIPIKTRRIDMREWQIVRGTSR
jgi:hypothetical protein